MDAHPAGAVGVRVRCSGNGSLDGVAAREVDRRQARMKKLLLKNEGRILASTRGMRKHRMKPCGAQPTQPRDESNCAFTPY